MNDALVRVQVARLLGMFYAKLTRLYSLPLRLISFTRGMDSKIGAVLLGCLHSLFSFDQFRTTVIINILAPLMALGADVMPVIRLSKKYFNKRG
jgi:hypothetical protein